MNSSEGKHSDVNPVILTALIAWGGTVTSAWAAEITFTETSKNVWTHAALGNYNTEYLCWFINSSEKKLLIDYQKFFM